MRNTRNFCHVNMPNYRDFFTKPYSAVICLNSCKIDNTICDTIIYYNLRTNEYNKIPSIYVRYTNKMTTNTLSELYSHVHY